MSIAVAPVTIRRAAADDAPAIAEVHVASWRSAYRGMMSESFLEELSIQERAEGWRSTIEDPASVVLVAERAGVVAGFVGGLAPATEDAEIDSLHVDPAAVGAGTGAALLHAAEAALAERGSTRARLWVIEDNERARSFYEREGWRFNGVTERLSACDGALNARYVRDLRAEEPADVSD